MRFVIIGGIAGRLWGSTTVTNDLDICYARDAANLESLAAALADLKAKLRGAHRDVPFIADARTLKGATTSPSPPAPATSRFSASRLARTTTDMDVGGVAVPVAAIEDLILMKRAAARPKDLIEVESSPRCGRS